MIRARFDRKYRNIGRDQPNTEVGDQSLHTRSRSLYSTLLRNPDFMRCILRASAIFKPELLLSALSSVSVPLFSAIRRYRRRIAECRNLIPLVRAQVEIGCGQ